MTPGERLGISVTELATSLGLDPDTTLAYLTADLLSPASEANRKPDKGMAIRILEGIEALRQKTSHPRRIQR